MDSLSPHSTQVLDALLSKLDADKISDPSLISDQILLRELKFIADHLLSHCPHFSPEQKEVVESEVMSYLESVNRDDLTVAIKSCPEEDPSVVRRLIWCVSFCCFGVLAIVTLPIVWGGDLLDWLRPANTAAKEGERCQSSEYERVSDVSTAVSRCLWPDKPVACYCCSVGACE